MIHRLLILVCFVVGGASLLLLVAHVSESSPSHALIYLSPALRSMMAGASLALTGLLHVWACYLMPRYFMTGAQ